MQTAVAAVVAMGVGGLVAEEASGREVAAVERATRAAAMAGLAAASEAARTWRTRRSGTNGRRRWSPRVPCTSLCSP